jgi:hypothetical protein
MNCQNLPQNFPEDPLVIRAEDATTQLMTALAERGGEPWVGPGASMPKALAR